MTIGDVQRLLDAKILCEGGGLDTEVHAGCGSDLMSDVLAFVKEQSILLTGLVNSQVVRTAEMMDMVCVIFVRGKCPDEDTIGLARERDIAVLRTSHTMFSACGILYQNGLKGGESRDE